MQTIRDKFGAIKITSGWRSKELNKVISGSSKTSQHLKGEACDFKCDNLGEVFEWIRKNIDFDQLIWEYGTDESPAWIHISFKFTGNRNEVLRVDQKNGYYAI